MCVALLWKWFQRPANVSAILEWKRRSQTPAGLELRWWRRSQKKWASTRVDYGGPCHRLSWLEAVMKAKTCERLVATRNVAIRRLVLRVFDSWHRKGRWRLWRRNYNMWALLTGFLICQEINDAPVELHTDDVMSCSDWCCPVWLYWNEGM